MLNLEDLKQMIVLDPMSRFDPTLIGIALDCRNGVHIYGESFNIRTLSTSLLQNAELKEKYALQSWNIFYQKQNLNFIKEQLSPVKGND